MSITDIFPEVPEDKNTQSLSEVAQQYGLVCFKIELAKEVEAKISGELIRIKFELENKLKQLLYA
jgi:UV DNA damage repair endonuclease